MDTVLREPCISVHFYTCPTDVFSLTPCLPSGLEKYELLAKLAGNEDPFFLKAISRTGTSKANPTIVNAMDNYRMVGCICAEEDTNVKWTWLSEVTNDRRS